ncbi:conjugal transfer protein TraG N-terminal domain-containing protein [uncultured Umboniibacter sp.]|uniref:conjugal transfer protein TraG N-terminal domain-containing protein n=1 Tax=uncultured Umboniibacter sp. TaxID=1798917 RepID=UPI00262CDA46|nr:conjugal transfer protein TraG N-terminal domain-containing protein [uncultured Umboniibacter sp.]
MSFDLYSIGDSAFLEQVLISIAIFFQTGTFFSLVKLGLIIGFLMMIVSSLAGSNGQKFDLGAWILSVIIIQIAFIPKSEVVITDVYTGQVRVVANVPAGIAFTGSVVSTIGHRLTSVMEAAFDPVSPKMTDGEFMEPLRIISGLRRNATQEGIFTAANSALGSGADLKRTLEEYIKNCTLKAVALEELSYADLATGDLDSTLPYMSPFYTTSTYLGTVGDPVLDTCATAWGKIDTALTTMTGNAQVIAGYDSILGIDPETDNANSFAKAATAVNMMTAGSLNAQQFVRLSLLEPILQDALRGKYTDHLDTSSAQMINEAIMLRNSQWASDYSFFQTIVRPMIAFLEAFTFAIAPIMAFVLALGSFGLKLGSKYLMFLVWIQLWYPILAIINLYIYVGATRDWDNYTLLTNYDWNSFYALNNAYQTAETWIATGGYLASSTPVLALMLMYGSSYAATSLARGMSPDNMNEKLISPETSNTPSVASLNTSIQQDALGGARAGADQLGSQLKFDSGLTAAQTSTLANNSQLQQSAAQQVSSLLSSSNMSGWSSAQQSQLSEAVGANLISSGVYSEAQAQQFSKQFSDSNMTTAQAATMMSLMSSASIGTPAEFLVGSGAKIALSGNQSEGEAFSEAQSFAINAMNTSSQQSGETIQDVAQRSLNASFNQVDSETLSGNTAFTDTKTATQSAVESQARTNTFLESASATQSGGANDGISVKDATKFINSSTGAQDDLFNTTIDGQSIKSTEAYKANYNAIHDRSVFETDRENQIWAATQTLASSGNDGLAAIASSLSRVGGQESRFEGYGKLLNTAQTDQLDVVTSSQPSYANPGENSGLGRPASDAEFNQVAAAATTAGENAGNASDRLTSTDISAQDIAAQRNDPSTQDQSNRGQVESRQDSNESAVSDVASSNQIETAREKSVAAQNRFASQIFDSDGADQNNFSYAARNFENAGDFLTSFGGFDSIVSGGASYAADMVAQVQQGVETRQGLSDALNGANFSPDQAEAYVDRQIEALEAKYPNVDVSGIQGTGFANDLMNSSVDGGEVLEQVSPDKLAQLTTLQAYDNAAKTERGEIIGEMRERLSKAGGGDVGVALEDQAKNLNLGTDSLTNLTAESFKTAFGVGNEEDYKAAYNAFAVDLVNDRGAISGPNDSGMAFYMKDATDYKGDPVVDENGNTPQVIDYSSPAYVTDSQGYISPVDDDLARYQNATVAVVTGAGNFGDSLGTANGFTELQTAEHTRAQVNETASRDGTELRDQLEEKVARQSTPAN